MKKLILYIFVFFIPFFSQAQEKYSPEQLKAALIYKLINWVYWQFYHDSTNFVFFYFGENQNFISEFEKWNYLKLKNRNVVFEYSTGFFELPENKIPDVIFVDKNRSDQLKDIFYKIAGKHILLISEDAGNLDFTMINIFEINNRVEFEVNKQNLDNQGFEYSPKLLIYGGRIDEVRDLYKNQELKIKKIKEKLDSIEVALAEKMKILNQQQAFIKAQLDTIEKQKELIEKQKQELKLQQQKIEKQKLYLANLLFTINQQKDTLLKKKEELNLQKKLLDSQKVMLYIQQKKINESKQLYDSIRQEILKQKEILEKQKYLIELQKKGLFIAIVFVILLLGLAFIIYRNYQIKKRTNEILEQKNALIKQQNEELKSQSEILKNQAEELKTQAEHLAMINAELETLSLVASYTDNAVFIMDGSGRVQWVNRSFIKFYGKDKYTEVIEKKLKLNEFRNIPDFENILQKIIAEKISYQFIEPINFENQILWIQTSITPIFKQGKLQKIIAVDTDITKTKKAEEALSQQNKEIKQSITYASRIQGAVLPQKELLDKVFKDYFILYRPRDIVSGDFYFIVRKMNKIIFTASDCTGHGVPGAFMSMLGTSLLNSTINTLYERHGIEFLSPALILGSVRRLIIRLLHQQEGDINEPKDGMDMALCVYSPKENTLEFAGANNPLYLIRKAENPKPEVEDKFLRVIEAEKIVLYEIKPDKMPVGIHRKYNQPFTNKKFTIYEGDTIYLFSDGFSDQFGGPENKKFMSKNFKKLLISVYDKPMQEQKKVLEETLDYWLSFRKNKKHGGQTDDILVWGIRF